MVFTEKRGEKKNLDELMIICKPTTAEKKQKKKNFRTASDVFFDTCAEVAEGCTRRDATQHPDGSSRESPPALGRRDGSRFVLITFPSFFSSVSTRQEEAARKKTKKV